MTAFALLLLAIGFVLIHAALTGKSLQEIVSSGLPSSSATPGLGSKSVKK